MHEESDVRSYVKDFSVDWNTAELELGLQDAADRVDFESLGDSYAGTSITREPSWQLNVYATEQPPDPFDAQVVALGLQGRVAVHLVDRSMANMQEEQRQLVDSPIWRALATGRLNSHIDVDTNRVVVEANDSSALAQLSAALPSAIANRIETRLVLGQSDQPAAGGGAPISGCTSGFTVRRTTDGVRGVSTAGHCSNTQVYAGTTLSFRAELYGGRDDIQWHSSAALTWRNTVSDVSGDPDTPYYRYITSREATTNIRLGNYYCKTGATTGYTCGQVVGVNFCPGYGGLTCQFFLVENFSENMDDIGDRGGPVYASNKAVGTISGANSQPGHYKRAIVGPQAYFSDLGVEVAIS